MGSAVNSNVLAIAGTTLTSTASCPAGTAIFGGGGSVTERDLLGNLLLLQTVAVKESEPQPEGTAHPTTWELTGVVTANLTALQRMRVEAFVVCSSP